MVARFLAVFILLIYSTAYADVSKHVQELTSVFLNGCLSGKKPRLCASYLSALKEPIEDVQSVEKVLQLVKEKSGPNGTREWKQVHSLISLKLKEPAVRELYYRHFTSVVETIACPNDIEERKKEMLRNASALCEDPFRAQPIGAWNCIEDEKDTGSVTVKDSVTADTRPCLSDDKPQICKVEIMCVLDPSKLDAYKQKRLKEKIEKPPFRRWKKRPGSSRKTIRMESCPSCDNCRGGYERKAPSTETSGSDDKPNCVQCLSDKDCNSAYKCKDELCVRSELRF